jgi:energy-coupling factor transport system ATP-binding protein
MAPIIRVENLHYTYQPDTGQPVPALLGVDLTVEQGEYLVILGHNGSGKSTLAKHLNALLLPTSGEVWVKDWNTKDKAHLRDIRSTVGMVFQTPDNQIVATIVEEDVAFGPENLGLPHDEIVRRVDWSLERVDMSPFRHRAPHLLSGGQKQRICIAGTLAMKPQVLVLDESTAMLDPLGRREVLDVARRLNKEEGVTVVAITHHMDEAVEADRIVVMEAGRIVLQGTPREIFGQAGRLRELQMDVPPVTQLAAALSQRVPGFPHDVFTVSELVSAVEQRVSGRDGSTVEPVSADEAASHGEAVIQIKNLGHFYMRDTPLEVKAIEGVNIEVYAGEILGIIGHTGSGKSTIIQHFNGLMRPHEGEVTIFGQDMRSPNADLKTIRRRVGLVFQQPEAQLFEHYVGDDVAYGPRNLKLSREEVRERVRRAMEAVGLGFEEFKDRLTFALSGGQMRRVALAGVLALEPEVLVLDEPTSGLDPRGREQLFERIMALRERGLTLVIISHNMEELARVCHRICVISEGKAVMTGAPAEVFGRAQFLREMGLGVPGVTEAVSQLQGKGVIRDGSVALTVQQAAEMLERALNG